MKCGIIVTCMFALTAISAAIPGQAQPIPSSGESPTAAIDEHPSRLNHPYHEYLREAYDRENDVEHRAILAANLRRWEALPASLGPRYLLVNAAAFEVTLWEGRREMGRWRAIVGTQQTPTPIFQAEVSGVIFNPWWEIPTSISAGNISSMVRNRPAEARRRGYVYENGRYRQRPGSNNALGLMKLVMPNPHSVYLHDTPNRTLFERDVRALSHGCVRVGDAIGFAAELLAARPGWNRAMADEIVASGHTIRVDLPEPIPVYISYFTAEADSEGNVRYYPDIYNRDRGSQTLSATDDVDDHISERCEA